MTVGLGELKPGFLLDILAFGGQDATPTGSIAVASQGTAYSKSFPLRRGVEFGWEVQFTSSGTVAVKVELEQGNVRPSTEQTVDAVNFCVPDNKSAVPMFADVADSNLHVAAYSPDATAYGRLKFTGLTGNHATTVCSKARVYAVKNN